MTLRITVEIVPYGDEEAAYQIGCLDISNIETVERGHFGADICRYSVTNKTDVGDFSWPEVKRHARRDEFWELIRKALSLKSDLDKFSNYGEEIV